MIILSTFHGDPNLGIFFACNEKICLVPKSIETKNIRNIKKCLKVETVKIKIAESDLIGIFCALNSNGILVSDLIKDGELKELKNKIKSFDMNVEKISSKYSAIGNLILCNDKGAIISKLISRKEKRKIEDCLGVEVEYAKIAKLNIVGSCGIATNKGCLLHRDVKANEINRVEDILKVNADIGTVNFGSPFVKSGLIANSEGCLLGEKTTPPELARIMEALNLS